jgi:WS/DGAT/MGAT family acyltransferase
VTKSIPLLDLAFFALEAQNNPKHVGALMVFDLPRVARKTFVPAIVAAYRSAMPLAPFDQVIDTGLTYAPRWKRAGVVDLTYHVEHIRLRRPGSHAQLLAKVAELHRELLDRSRPCFRVYVIENLAERRFAVYFKIHHAMVDGQSAVMRIVASLSEDPANRSATPFFAVAMDAAPAACKPVRDGFVRSLKSFAVKQAVAAREVYVGQLRRGLRRLGAAQDAGSAPFTAPSGPTNARIDGRRSLATLSLPIADMRAVAHAFGGTLNDVCATIVDSGLTRYLDARGEAPMKPLVALCPVSLREPGDTEATTKASMMFVPLGDPAMEIGARMKGVMRASQSAKGELRGLSKDAASLYALLAFGLGEAAGLFGTGGVTPPLANFILSNVPGPRAPLYLRGARLAGMFPISALGAGIGLNVTLVSCADRMDFGFVATARRCRIWTASRRRRRRRFLNCKQPPRAAQRREASSVARRRAHRIRGWRGAWREPRQQAAPEARPPFSGGARLAPNP